jgi:sugar lactone lactonase YvrE
MTIHREHSVLVAGLGFPESLRWHDDALWYADWAAGQVFRLGSGGTPELVATGAGFPLCFDLRDADSGPVPVLVAGLPALAGVSEHPWNEIVLGECGAYVNNIGFAYDGSIAPSAAGAVGFVVLVRPDGSTERVAEGLAFPNGMALVDDGRTLLVAESWGSRLTAYAVDADGRLGKRRVWAETPGLHPDGIDAHPDGTVSFADVGQSCCVRVAEGGEVLDRAELPQPAFDCVVGDLGDGPTLFVAVNDFGGAPPPEPAGRILAVPLS